MTKMSSLENKKVGSSKTEKKMTKFGLGKDGSKSAITLAKQQEAKKKFWNFVFQRKDAEKKAEDKGKLMDTKEDDEKTEDVNFSTIMEAVNRTGGVIVWCFIVASFFF